MCHFYAPLARARCQTPGQSKAESFLVLDVYIQRSFDLMIVRPFGWTSAKLYVTEVACNRRDLTIFYIILQVVLANTIALATVCAPHSFRRIQIESSFNPWKGCCDQKNSWAYFAIGILKSKKTSIGFGHVGLKLRRWLPLPKIFPVWECCLQPF